MTMHPVPRTVSHYMLRGLVAASLLLVAATSVARVAPIVPSGSSDWTEQRVLDPQGAGYDQFGLAVALSGPVALVAAPSALFGGDTTQGKVLIYNQAGDGSWSLAQTLVANALEQFGWSVAIAGQTAVIGALNARVGKNNSQGAAYVYTQDSDGVWSETQQLVASDGSAVDWFGNAVAMSDDMIVVGAYGAHYNDEAMRGSVYVFTQVGGVWTQTQQLAASDGTVSDQFGNAVALSGSNLLVSAPGAKIADHYAQGAVYRFELSGGTWTEAQKIVVADGAEYDQLGTSLAIDGDTALIGAMWRQGGQGAVYVLADSGSGWNPVQQLGASDGVANQTNGVGPPSSDSFGISVALQGGTALIGASHAIVDGNPDQGAAYQFVKEGGLFTGSHTFTSNDGIAAPYFGAAVALDGDNVLAGMFGYTPDWDHYYQGAAYFYQRVASGIPASERAALIDLYTSTSGDGWWDMIGWLGEPGTECTWTGVTCDDSGSTVVGLYFGFTNMIGTLPPSLNQLTNLTSLQIADQSQLTGNFPSLTGMTQLLSVDISNTALTGRLPSLAGLTNLQAANFVNNQFNGSIPPFGDLPALAWFAASYNQLSGRVPSLAGLTSLSAFFVDTNMLSGSPPSPPASLGEYGATLCPNAFDHVESTVWDAITGITPWYRDCTAAPDAVFADGFEG